MSYAEAAKRHRDLGDRQGSSALSEAEQAEMRGLEEWMDHQDEVSSLNRG